PIAPPITPPIEKEEFEKLSELIQKRKKPREPLVKIKKLPPKKADEFARLQKLIESKKPILKKPKKDLTPKERQDVKDLFYRLSQLKKEVSKKK
ncbi:hypothetical protein KY332_03135, partial [Candidatus Woesearchaeota archaeon]|nr:hypothetical protein [Candidatus Woesearchaeota archaeon]